MPFREHRHAVTRQGQVGPDYQQLEAVGAGSGGENHDTNDDDPDGACCVEDHEGDRPCCVFVLEKAPDPGDLGGSALKANEKLNIQLTKRKDELIERLKGYTHDPVTLAPVHNHTGLETQLKENQEGTEWYLKVYINEKYLFKRAEKLDIKVKIKRAYGGHVCKFRKILIDIYDNNHMGELFSSAQTQQCIVSVIRGEDSHACNINIEDEIELGNIKQFFRAHYALPRKRLENLWTTPFNKPQPIELIREYFGEKIALYFVWLGYYTTMLWIPAIVGILMTFTQVYTYVYTDSMDNPWVPLYCVFTALWAVLYLEGWKRLENAKQRLWDTLDFEDEEEDRPDFTAKAPIRWNKMRQEHEHYIAPETRLLKLTVSIFIVSLFIITVIFVVCGLMTFKFLSKEWFGLLGGPVGGVTNAVSIMIFNLIYGKVVDILTDWETWQTDTEHDDAKIAKDFCFKFVNAYFALYFVAFIQNYMPVFGIDQHCPLYHCMPVLTMTLGAVFGTQIVVQQSIEAGLVKLVIKKLKASFAKLSSADEDSDPEKEALISGDMSRLGVVDIDLQEQAALEEYEGVFDDYNEMVLQFGYVTLFAAAFPLTASLALLNNIIEIRVDATKILLQTQRPPNLGAQDIGTWMDILEVLVTASVITNVGLVGFTSHGLFFYFPDMDEVLRVWIVIIAEHILLFLKVFIQALVPDTAESVIEDYLMRKHLLNKAVENFTVTSQIKFADESSEESGTSESDNSDDASTHYGAGSFKSPASRKSGRSAKSRGSARTSGSHSAKSKDGKKKDKKK